MYKDTDSVGFNIPEGFDPKVEDIVNYEFFKKDEVDKDWINSYFENILKEVIDKKD